MNAINGIWHQQRTGILRAAMIDGWMTVTKKPGSFDWEVVVRGQCYSGIATSKEDAMRDAETQYADLHKGAQS